MTDGSVKIVQCARSQGLVDGIIGMMQGNYSTPTHFKRNRQLHSWSLMFFFPIKLYRGQVIFPLKTKHGKSDMVKLFLISRTFVVFLITCTLPSQSELLFQMNSNHSPFTVTKKRCWHIFQHNVLSMSSRRLSKSPAKLSITDYKFTHLLDALFIEDGTYGFCIPFHHLDVKI